MGFAIVFTGQGSQHPAMLPWLAEDALVRDTCARLAITDWRSGLADPAWAEANAKAQVLLTGLALAAWQQIASALPAPAAVAGYSVGELAAFSAAGVFDARQALDLAGLRAQAMDRCGQQVPGGLLAVSGLTMDALERLCADTGCALAIRNGLDTAVIGGPLAALQQAESAAALRGARVRRLGIGIASHTPWMREAADAFAEILAHHPAHRPRTALFSNALGRVQNEAQARTALATQIASTVRWTDCMEDLYARAPHCVLEIGPGQALARLWNQRYPDVPARSCDDFRSAQAVTAWVLGACRPS